MAEESQTNSFTSLPISVLITGAGIISQYNERTLDTPITAVTRTSTDESPSNSCMNGCV